ncbi:hypothetical protein MMUR_20650 [Mycolicibacterium murale]|uniref:Uncharacterized protein n=1 Tax=Mycolicibacterium murale TaxID=182220 RepID=A0A7I9WK09_9MYCO|nr:hypothetical protein MMUR_20650 [Mycolicibacterium murale]
MGYTAYVVAREFLLAALSRAVTPEPAPRGVDASRETAARNIASDATDPAGAPTVYWSHLSVADLEEQCDSATSRCPYTLQAARGRTPCAKTGRR